MSKVSNLCIISLLLLLTISSSVVARPAATFYDVTPMETQPGRSLDTNSEDVEKVDTEGSSCEGLEEDECMMRRTLEAHIDYIYTQKQTQP